MTEDTQTDDRPVDARTRTEDYDNGRRIRFRRWWAKWKDICIAAVLIPTALGCLVLGLQMRGYSRARAYDAQIVRQLAQQRAADAAATTKAARQACERSRALGPSLYEDYRIRQVLTGEKLALYRSLIPKTCPK